MGVSFWYDTRLCAGYEKQIFANGEIVSDAGGTVTFGIKGVEQLIEVEAFGSHQIRCHFHRVHFLEVPLYLWNSEADRYIHAYGIDPEQGIETGVEEWLPIGRVGQLELSSSSEFDLRSAHLDYYFPGRLAEEIEIALRHLNVFFDGPIEPPPDLSAADIQALRTFLFGADLEDVTSALCLSIRPADPRVVEDRTDDNQVCSPLALLLPPVQLQPPPPPIPPPVPPLYTVPSEPIFADAMYRAGWPGKYFGASIDFSASSSADTDGAVVAGKTEIPVTLFGSTFQFLGIEARAQVLPLSDRFASEEARAQLKPGFLMKKSILNQIIYVKNDPPEGSLGTLSVSWSIEFPEYLPPEPDDTPEEIKKRRPPYYASIGPVPVEFRPQVTGNIDEWVAQEANASGRYDAKYTRKSPSSIVTEKQRYVDSAPSSTGTVSVVNSAESVTIDVEQDWISAMHVDEVLKTDDSNGFSFEVNNLASLELLSSRAVAKQADSKWNFVAVSAPASSASVVQRPVEKLRVKKLKGKCVPYCSPSMRLLTPGPKTFTVCAI